MGVTISTGPAAFTDERRAAWAALAEVCPWTTAYMCPRVAVAWYEAYADVYEPVLVHEDGPDGPRGVLPLARHRRTGALEVAVGRPSAVQGWLAPPLLGSYFLERALDAVQARFPGQDLVFEALAPGMPTDWLAESRRFGRLTRTEPVPRWIETLDPARARKKLDKRTNAQQIAGLKAHGELRYTPSLEPEALATALPDLTRWHDQVCADMARPARFVEDPAELDFWRRLGGQSGRFVAAALHVGDTLAAAILAVRIRSRLYVAWGAERPALETLGPGQVLWRLMEPDLLADGVVDAEVSEGFDWMQIGAEKRTFSTRAAVLLSPKSRVSDGLSSAMVGLSKWALRRLDR